MATWFRIVLDPDQATAGDPLAGRRFSSYDAAYDELERYCGDLCCSDERLFYRIVEEQSADPAVVG